MLRVKDIKDEFPVCGECKEEFDEDDNVPRVLSCLHTFCQNCLDKMMIKHVIRCPHCNAKCHIPEDGVSGLPKDVTRSNMGEFFKVKQRSSEILCRGCPEDSAASDFCRDCHIYLCIECSNAHKRSLASRNHVVLGIDELQRSGPDSFQRKMKCLKTGHEGQPLEFYCSAIGCKTLVCSTCTVSHHAESKGHIIQPVTEYHTRKSKKLQEKLEIMNENIKMSKKSEQQYKQDLVNMDIKEFEAEKEIDVCFSACQKALERRRQEVKQHLTSICQSRKCDLQSHVASLEQFIDDMSNARDFLESILKHTDPTEFVSLHDTFTKRMKNLAKQKIDINIEFKIPVFEPVDMGEEFLNFVSVMGKVISNPQKLTHVDRNRSQMCPSPLESDAINYHFKPNASFERHTDFGKYLPRIAESRESKSTLNDSFEFQENDGIETEQHNEVNLRLMSTSPIIDHMSVSPTESTEPIPRSRHSEGDSKAEPIIDRGTIERTYKISRSKSFDLKTPRFVRGKTEIGPILPSLYPNSKKSQLAKSLTELGASLRSKHKVTETSDKKFRNIVCPVFTFDEQTVHRFREVINGRTLTNQTKGNVSHGTDKSTNLQNFRGVVGSRSFKHPGKFYYEVEVNYLIKTTLENTNMVFEIGLCRLDEIDIGYCIYNQENGWSFSIQHCPEHLSLCQWCRHDGKCFSHVQQISSARGSFIGEQLRYGFLLDTDRKKWTVIDIKRQKLLHKFQYVDCSRPLWPVFGCHWPSKVTVEMTLITGHDIFVLPNCIQA